EHDHISKITLNRPNALNAINDKMGEELLATLKDTEKSETVRCLVITGAGRAFSAGEDVAGLKERYGEGAHPSLGDHLRKKYQPIMTGKTISAKEAEQLGLINKVVSAAELDKHTDELAHRLATGPTKALGLSKRIVNRVTSLELPEALDYEAYNQDIAGRTGDHL